MKGNSAEAPYHPRRLPSRRRLMPERPQARASMSSPFFSVLSDNSRPSEALNAPHWSCRVGGAHRDDYPARRDA